MAIVQTIEHDGRGIRVIKLAGLATRGQGYPRVPHRRIEHVVMHQSDGNPLAGLDAPVRIAKFHAGDPTYKRDAAGNVLYRKVHGKPRPWWIGGGRGWPGIGYTFVVPAVPELQNGRQVVYRCHDDEIRSYHTNTPLNSHGVAVVVAGTYASRHAPKNAHAIPSPSPAVMAALDEFVLEYLLPKYNITAEEGLLGHFDAGKPACPGDFLEQWVRFHRGEDVEDPMRPGMPAPAPTLDKRPLATVRERQAALLALGYDLGPAGVDGVWGQRCKTALIAFQTMEGLVPDGIWGPKTELALRAALAAGGA